MSANAIITGSNCQHDNECTTETGTSSRTNRGPTIMTEVHTRPVENRKPIVLNDLNQPIGPNDSTLTEFSSFLGTVAKMATLVPLTVKNWLYMPTKEAIWKYVQRKAEMCINSRKMQKNMHTAGKTNFARIRKKLQAANVNNEPPTNSALFIETRKRKADRIYKDSYDDTRNLIAQMEDVQSQQTTENQSVNAFSLVMGGVRPGRVMLYGRGVTPTDIKGKGIMDGSYVNASEDFIQSMQEKVDAY